MRKKIVAGNWKMNMDYLEGVSLFSEIVNMAKDELRGDQHLIVCSPFIHLASLARLAKNQDWVSVGAQNIHHERAGAYTGEISASQVASIGAEYVIVGHSERRTYFQEDNLILSKKVDLALKQGLKILFCVGESEDERRQGAQFEVIEKQLESVLGHVSPELFPQVIVAYEPVWAIGTGQTASPEQAQEMHARIREILARLFDGKRAMQTSILYGGSCNAGNAEALFAQSDIDGGLIGGASLKSREFINIAKVFNP